ncbi:T6SS effector amidase Tae4 family protein [Larkinella soli]|uniref:T6SS effector amidase Tae4 family protein n=1 Tax=Larkinella soli TaxID=1770527 RepID=UPI000FFC3FE2|nr:T6SS effector amidase Tae4 family protein [Larkinella soli]
MAHMSRELEAMLGSGSPVLQPDGFRPSYGDLLRIYQTYTGDQDLREGGLYRNECAVRMSLALSLCGFSFQSFRRQSRVVAGGRSGLPLAHVYGAKELADHLRIVWGRPEMFDGGGRSAATEATSSLEGRQGVIYFNDCFTRSDGTKGDHIDLWTGAKYYNQVLGIGAGVEDLSSRRSLFRKADKIWFWQLA